MRSNSPISMTDLEAAVPAVFQKNAADARSSRYAHVHTLPIVEAMNDAGYGISRAQQKKTRTKEASGFTRHLLAFRPLKAFSETRVGDAIPEVVLINSHDATCAFRMYAGLFRLVCENGMIVGDTLDSIRVIHRGDAAQQVVDATSRIMETYVPQLRQWVGAAQGLQLTPLQRSSFALQASNIRWPNNSAPFDAELLLRERRKNDVGDDLWHVYNRVQENLMRGGIEGRSATGRSVTSQPINRVTKDVMFNRQLWDVASTFLEEAA